MNENGLTPTQQLAAWAVAQSPATLPSDVLELAKDCLLDHIAVALHGMNQPWTRLFADQVTHEAGRPEASVYGRTTKLPVRAAALVNASAAHAFELDAWHGGSLSHLSACVIPAVLAVAERERLSGGAVLAAIVAGFEVMARAGMATIPTLIIRGFHPTGTHGPIGAAAGVSNLLHLAPAQATAAIGIAASCSGGLMEFSQDAQGTMVKRLHAGRSAESGVLAASLAQRGITAPKSALDGKFGYCKVFSEAPRIDELTRALGEDFQIRYINTKPYACCGALHAAINAVERLMKEHGFADSDVASVVFGGNDSHMQRHTSAVPDSVMAAQYSIPYAIAVALTGRALDPRMFDEGAYRDTQLVDLAGRVRMELHPEVVRAYPEMLGGYVRIGLRDGRVVDKLVLEARGTIGEPLGRGGIVEKAQALCAPLMDDEAMRALFSLILDFDSLKDVSALAPMLYRAIRSPDRVATA
ncbi:MAG: MmgE/PrpD family protein [Pseudomonadota bacterium]